MSGTNQKNSVLTTIKLYLFPSIATLLGMMIWRDISELKSDVKQLLAESNSNKAKVENLERQVQQLNQAVFRIPKTTKNNLPEKNDPQYKQMYAILNKEQEFDIKKFVPYKTN